MRPIKFRGKRVYDGKWVYGFYYEWRSKFRKEKFLACIHTIHYASNGLKISDEQYDIIPKTVGQYTGFKDKNGKESYFQDLIKVGSRIYEIRWNSLQGKIFLHSLTKGNSYFLNTSIIGDGEVIGNIYDNKELLEK